MMRICGEMQQMSCRTASPGRVRAKASFLSSQEALPLAAVGRHRLDDAVALDQVELVEALAQLAGLRVAEPDAAADAQPVGGGAEQRRLHLAGTLPPVEPQAGREHRSRQARAVA